MNLNTGKYWDKAWQLVDGCSPVSAGCDNCWSASLTHRFKDGFTTEGKFNGVIRIREDRLVLPLKTKKPTVWSVWNDLFHEDVPMEFIAEVFDVMASCRYVCKHRHEHDAECETEETGHTYLILTKRAERMRDVLEELPDYIGERWGGDTALSLEMEFGTWPPENVYFGTSIENQQTADERIPYLLQIPGKKFLSIEPMLGLIDLKLNDEFPDASGCYEDARHNISQVICGDETGRNARPCHPDWVSSIRDQCKAAGVPFFFKRFNTGYFTSAMQMGGRHLDGRTYDDLAWKKI